MSKSSYSVQKIRNLYEEITVCLKNKFLELIAVQEYSPSNWFLHDLSAEVPSTISDFLEQATDAYNSSYGKEDRNTDHIERRERTTEYVEELYNVWNIIVEYIPANLRHYHNVPWNCDFNCARSVGLNLINIEDSKERKKQLQLLLTCLAEAEKVAITIISNKDDLCDNSD